MGSAILVLIAALTLGIMEEEHIKMKLKMTFYKSLKVQRTLIIIAACLTAALAVNFILLEWYWHTVLTLPVLLLFWRTRLSLNSHIESIERFLRDEVY